MAKLTIEQMDQRKAENVAAVKKYQKIEAAIQRLGWDRVAKDKTGSATLKELAANAFVRGLIYTAAARGGANITIAVQIFAGMDAKGQQIKVRRFQLAKEIFEKTGGVIGGKVVGRAIMKPAGRREFKSLLDSLSANQLSEFGVDPKLEENTAGLSLRGVSALDILDEERPQFSEFQKLWFWAHRPQTTDKERGKQRQVAAASPAKRKERSEVEAFLEDELPSVEPLTVAEEPEDEVEEDLNLLGGEDDDEDEDGGGLEAVGVTAAASTTPVAKAAPKKAKATKVAVPTTPSATLVPLENPAEDLAEILELVGKPAALALAKKLRAGAITFADASAKSRIFEYV